MQFDELIDKVSDLERRVIALEPPGKTADAVEHADLPIKTAEPVHMDPKSLAGTIALTPVTATVTTKP